MVETVNHPKDLLVTIVSLRKVFRKALSSNPGRGQRFFANG